jgi:starch synthase (maltosyl-transferring)
MTIERAPTNRAREPRSPEPAASGPLAAGAGGAEQAPLPRIIVQDVRPATPHGYPAKAVVGQPAPVTANIFKDGHDILAARAVLLRDGEIVDSCPLTSTGNDQWSGAVAPKQMGTHELVVEAWTDRYATWAHKAAIKLDAAQDVSTEVAEAVLMVSGLSGSGLSGSGLSGSGLPGSGLPGFGLLDDGKAIEGPGPDEDGPGPDEDGPGPDEDGLPSALALLLDVGADDAIRAQAALSAPVANALAGDGLATDTTVSAPLPIWVDRERAGVGAWYELFPRSFGGLRATAAQVRRVAEMGFDILYLPPVHPIGHSYRKGKNNTLVTAEGDPGSPWATGSEAGGHTAIHPDLGDFDDFAYLVQTVREHGMEIALDYALNFSPDHPWVRQHPEWFHHRPDGTIAYAENPPKKYQDIYPLNFWPNAEADRVALWEACKGIVDFWAERGVRIFRVDNPHTKPFAFWEWLIGALKTEHPDIVLLAEAFTRPKVMARLAEIGFSQSYTYFTWRVSQYGPEGIRTYVEELAHGPLADYMRPNFWPNTPDILSGPLRGGPPSAFALRFVLAATLTPCYGVYSGYELCENVPASPDNEEYWGSEKYEIKQRNFARPGSLAPLFRDINAIRRRHPAFSRLRTVHFHASDNPNVMAYSKAVEDMSDVVLVVVTLDPYVTQESTLHLDLAALGVSTDPFEVYDELSGETYTWGPHPYVKLEPWWRIAHVLEVRKPA